jgi:hypothetical protein
MLQFLNTMSPLQRETLCLLINRRLQNPELEHDTAAPNGLPDIITLREQPNSNQCFIGLRYGTPWERTWAAKELG